VSAVADRHVGGDRISAFLDDELDDERALEVTRHLAGCPGCLDELEALRATRDALRRLPGLQTPMPVLTVAGAVGANASLLRRTGRRLQLASAALAIVAGVAGIAYLAGDERGEIVPPVDLFLVDHVSRTGGGPVPAPLGVTGR
jgi:anti-sigma factor RsiW